MSRRVKRVLLISLSVIVILVIAGALLFKYYTAVEVSTKPLPTFNWAKQPFRPEESDKDSLRVATSYIIPITRTIPTGETQDLHPLADWVGDAKYIGLGEVTHGSKEIFDFKTRLVQYFVKEKGAKVLALEASIADCYRINQYVTKGIGNPKQLLVDMGMFTMKYQEYIYLIDWLKGFNQGKPSSVQIQVFGYDIQQPQSAAKLVLTYLQKLKIPIENEELTDFKALATDGRSVQQINPFKVFKYNSATKSMLTFYRSQKDKLIRESSKEDYYFHERVIETILQSWQLFKSKSIMSAFYKRDKFAFENVKWLAESQGKYPILLWAHNAHVQKKDIIYEDFIPTGEYLDQYKPKDYYTIGSVFYEGAVRAKYNDSITNVSLPKVDSISAEAFLAKAGFNNYLLNIKKAKNYKEWHKVLTDTTVIRSIGSAYQPDIPGRNYRLTIFDQQYDALFFFRKSSVPTPIE